MHVPGQIAAGGMGQVRISSSMRFGSVVPSVFDHERQSKCARVVRDRVTPSRPLSLMIKNHGKPWTEIGHAKIRETTGPTT